MVYSFTEIHKYYMDFYIDGKRAMAVIMPHYNMPYYFVYKLSIDLGRNRPSNEEFELRGKWPHNPLTIERTVKKRAMFKKVKK